MKITVIGAGNMGGALVRGLVRAGKEDITITARTQKTLDSFHAEFPMLHTTLDNQAAVKDADLIILAVKPWVIPNVISEINALLDLIIRLSYPLLPMSEQKNYADTWAVRMRRLST